MQYQGHLICVEFLENSNVLCSHNRLDLVDVRVAASVSLWFLCAHLQFFPLDTIASNGSVISSPGRARIKTNVLNDYFLADSNDGENAPLVLLKVSCSKLLMFRMPYFVDKLLTLSLYLIAFHHCWLFFVGGESLLLPVLRIYSLSLKSTWLLQLWYWHWCCLYLLVVSVGEKVFFTSSCFYILCGIAESCYTKCY